MGWMGVCTMVLLWGAEDNFVDLFSPLTFIWAVGIEPGSPISPASILLFFIIITNIIANNLQHHELFQGFFFCTCIS